MIFVISNRWAAQHVAQKQTKNPESLEVSQFGYQNWAKVL